MLHDWKSVNKAQKWVRTTGFRTETEGDDGFDISISAANHPAALTSPLSSTSREICCSAVRVKCRSCSSDENLEMSSWSINEQVERARRPHW